MLALVLPLLARCRPCHNDSVSWETVCNDLESTHRGDVWHIANRICTEDYCKVIEQCYL